MSIYSGVFSVSEKLASAKLNDLVLKLNTHTHNGTLGSKILGSDIDGIIPVANIDTGTTANKIVILDGSGKLPAVDGSNLTNLTAASFQQSSATGEVHISSGTYVDVSSLSVTISGAGTYLVLATVPWGGNDAVLALSINIDGATVVEQMSFNPINYNNYLCMALQWCVSLGAGSHTIKIQAKKPGGSGDPYICQGAYMGSRVLTAIKLT